MKEESRSNNSFDLIRMVAATAVLVSHSFVLFGKSEPSPALGETWGSLAVMVFFSVSGYLVCQSWELDPSARRFLVRRGLRILPGLFAAVIFTALVVGSWATKLPLASYLVSIETWSYILNNVALITSIDHLPGVFRDSAYPEAVNGSLWTLRYEVLMYGVLVIAGISGRLLHACAALLIFAAIGRAIFESNGVTTFKVPLPILWRVGLEFDLVNVAKLASFFFGSSLLYLLRKRIPLRVLPGIAVLGLSVLLPSVWRDAILPLSISYTTLAVAFKARIVPKIFRGMDLSYGIYIYAFPVQQVVSSIWIRHGWNWISALLIELSITYMLAWVSWSIVEKPAMTLKKRLLPTTASRVEPLPV